MNKTAKILDIVDLVAESAKKITPHVRQLLSLSDPKEIEVTVEDVKEKKKKKKKKS